MDKMYALNLNYFKELSMYILAGKKKLEEIRSTELPQLIAKAQTTNLPEDAQAAKDLDSLCDRFEKKDPRPGTDQDDLYPDGPSDPSGTGK